MPSSTSGRHRDRPAGGDRAQARQDALRQGGALPYPPPRRHIRQSWPLTRIMLRGDSHYARPEAMDWCEANGVIYLFGLAGSGPLIAKVEETADAVRTRRAVENAEVIRDFAETTHRAKSWSRERRAIARIEATRLGLDVRFVVTNTLKCPRTIYDTLYCARGQAENLIKAHKVHLASDR